MYCALIGDIINSRSIEDRSNMQDSFEEILNSINSTYSSTIEAKFTITIGDEFQGLLKEPYHLFNIIDKIKMKLYPTQVRFGIGIGKMATEIKSYAIGSDGPAYHVAREAIDEIKQGEIKYEQPIRDILVNSTLLNEDEFNELDILNSILSTCYFIESKWS